MTHSAQPQFPTASPLLPVLRKSPGQSHVPRFFSLKGHEDLRAILCRPYDLFVEISAYSRLDTAMARITDGAPDFGLSLTTQHSWRDDIAATITGALRDRFVLKNALIPSVEICLHEALLNALFHGNLELNSAMLSYDELEAYYATAWQRLGKEPYRGRRVTVAAWERGQCLELRVGDEGNGFSLDDTAQPNDRMPYGRGLHIIRSLADGVQLGEDKRTLCMWFGR